MFPYRDSRVTKIVLAVFFVLVAGYAFFEGRGLLYGPAVVIENRVMEVSEPLITIEGRAERIAALAMNGKAIPVTEDGSFSEPYVLSPGYNRISFEARDRYGKTTERAIEIMYTPEATSLPPPSTDPTPSTDSQPPSEASAGAAGQASLPQADETQE